MHAQRIYSQAIYGETRLILHQTNFKPKPPWGPTCLRSLYLVLELLGEVHGGVVDEAEPGGFATSEVGLEAKG